MAGFKAETGGTNQPRLFWPYLAYHHLPAMPLRSRQHDDRGPRRLAKPDTISVHYDGTNIKRCRRLAQSS